MAAGGGGGGRASSSSSAAASSSAGALEASLDRKLQAVTNTMESIQGLSSWCLENKRHHSTIVYHWMKWLRRSAFPHRLNLFYLANDVIQNCKRKNAIVFRDTFAEVLPEAASLVKDPSVSKSIERIFKIWEDRNVYPEETILALKEALTSTNPKAALKSKIVAEFRPQSLIDELLLYKRSEDQIELKEKQLSTMRVDVCSTETLKCLKDKTGGKKFSKEFEEASSKLEEFVNGLDKQVKNGPSLTEALENAGIFYEAQYKEVKVVANAYKTFANRVSNLKKKLDQLKATLPDPEESPVPSPSMDAPSPTGSESPFQGMGEEESARSPAGGNRKTVSPETVTDNRDVEDMELSDVEDDSSKIIVEERKEKQAAPASAPAKAESVPKAAPAAAATTAAVTPAPAPTPATPPAPKAVSAAPVAPAPALALPNLANVDLAKISSILSSLTSVMKNTGVSPASRPSPGTPTSPTALTSGLKTPVVGTPAAPSNPLANILSKVEITPESILSALSKTQTQTAPALQGLSSLLQSVAGSTAQPSEAASQSTSASPATTSGGKGRSVPSSSQPFAAKGFGYSPNSSTAEVSSTSVTKAPAGHTPGLSSSGFKPPTNSLGFSGSHPPSPSSLLPTDTSLAQPSDPPKAKLESEPPSPSLEMKIHNFLKGNPGFSGLNLNIPILSSLGSSVATESHAPDFQRAPAGTSLDNVDGTPVRDERSGTPTQDEMMDKPTSSNVDTISLLSKIMSPGSSTPSSTRSPLQGRDDSYSQELPNSVHGYRPFGLGRDSPAALYKQPGDSRDLLDSSQEKFYPDTSFQEDEDYRDFDYSGPPPSAMLNLEKKPTKSILKSSKLAEAAEYQPVLPSYGQRSQDFGVKPSFPQPMRSILDQGESCDPVAASPGLYGGYGLRGKDSASDGSPSPSSKNDVFFSPDSNHSSNLPKAVAHSGLSQKQYPDSPHSLPHRSLFSAPGGLSSPAGRASAPGADKALAASISATSTIEFKNMLKNASRKPAEEKHFGQVTKSGGGGSSGEGGASLAGAKAEPQPPEEHYRIETRVSSSCLDVPDSTEEKGAPIETLGYHNAASRGMSGEPIQTVESIRVLGKGSRGHGREAGRASGWFDMSGGGGAFDNGPSGSSELPGMGGFPAPYKEHVPPPFPDGVNSFRTNSFGPAFEHRLPPPLEHGPPFPRDPPGPPAAGPPPAPAKDHGGLFPRDHPVPPRMPSLDHANPFSKETSAPLPLPHGVPPPPSVEHAGVPFPTPPPPPGPADHAGVAFPAQPPPAGDHGAVSFPAAPPAAPPALAVEHGALHQGTMKEHFSVHAAARDPGAQPPPRDHGAAAPRAREAVPLTPPPLAREQQQLGAARGLGPPPAAPRDGGGRGGVLLRTPRPDFRPREPFVGRDPFHSLKRPRPPFARGGAPFFAPKRPFFPPRY
ncbi:regulation of nuclear pre-mRNA domain-containing protein 2 isoform X1 [Colius striatus]|uniref:regulation of nuclear pre-mRNA domain-containing protein 2 isoform X1 n=1 Tax=Colius striatus TaxID=57412 RepID=UPI002B1DD02E|nr:regulation of nuclear pre-mRNA domain-containing protein 2 isoform X1 [Colius striatus]